MDKLLKFAPVLQSPKFWGILAVSILSYVQAKGWIGGIEMEYLISLVMATTGVGIADSLFRKVGGKK